ncbi:MAG: hypothetical protein IV093_08160 [Rubrivivax sp.]|nr:hypothetical protein [Rubrivivax sp.]
MNRIHLIAAAAALVAAGTASALTPTEIAAARTAGTLKEVRIAGASALRLSVAAYMKEVCDTNTMHVIWNSNSEGTNHRAYACNLGVVQGSFAVGTPVLVYKRDQGGSGQGVNPIATIADQTHMRVVDDATCTTINGGGVVGNGSPAVPSYICTGTDTTGIKSDAGISDVEPRLLQDAQNLPAGTLALSTTQLNALDVAPLAQALFGVTVNKKAYVALQKAQGILPLNATAEEIAAADVPADQATWTAADIAKIPSLPETWVRAALTGQLLGGAPNATAKKGWNLVIPTTVDANVLTKTLNICRRTEGSGTQATSNTYFGNVGCSVRSGVQWNPLGVNGSSGNETTTSATVTSAPVLVQEGTSAGQVENCVGNDANTAVGGVDNTAYAVGYLGREANPKRAGGDLGYRYVKLDGRAPVRDVGKAGGYPIVFEATMQWNKNLIAVGTEKELFLKALRAGFGSPNGLAAVDSDTQQGVMSPPATYAGAYVDLVGNAALFGSRVARQNGDSCAALRIIK